MLKQLKTALILFFTLTIITGLLYPALITLVSQVVFPYQSNGSQVTLDNKVVGSSLIGQQFEDPRYFWGRLSATSDHPYNASSSGGSNYSVLNGDLENQVVQRLAALQQADPGNTQPVPVDLVTASGSGLDPDISVAAARYQAPRIARIRNIPLDRINTLIDQHTQGRQLSFLGEPRVNVLALNLSLDALK